MEITLKDDLVGAKKFRIPHIPIPKCADLLLSLIGPLTEEKGPAPSPPGYWPLPNPDEISSLFEEYFIREKHYTFSNLSQEEIIILERALKCHEPASGCVADRKPFESEVCCLPCSCVTLGGNRRLLIKEVYLGKIRRLFLGDLVWLFFMERMGMFTILHTLLSDFAYNGKYAFDVFDISSIIMNTWVELEKMGISSQTMDRKAPTSAALVGNNQVAKKN